ncbi:hypothetical protein [Arthrobacter burdickii]|uniref:Secreted protein n=1 Tax=Arthrobacter burdickii TaxID=3035920 RepID=A0ABT8K580_9MICC|nr:hypothetical protein [Arthrobacter burdickii]MDN4612605.1 hypothetical protein [Arthrobacter burdickii]
MTTQNTLCLSVLATLSLVAGSASAATATEEETPAPWPPAETRGYVPVPDEYYDFPPVSACGTTLTLTSGDVRDVQNKVQVKHDGETVVTYRGGATVDVSVAPDKTPGAAFPKGAFLDELDISGRGSVRTSADESTIVVKLQGPSIVYPTGSQVEAAALAGAGLPEIFIFERGKLTLEIRLSEDENAVEPDSVEILRNTTRDVVDLCQALKESAVQSD